MGEEGGDGEGEEEEFGSRTEDQDLGEDGRSSGGEDQALGEEGGVVRGDQSSLLQTEGGPLSSAKLARICRLEKAGQCPLSKEIDLVGL